MGTLIFDGDCGFCTTSAGWARRIAPDVETVAWQLTDLDALGVSETAARDAVQYVDDAGRVSGGAEAIARLLVAGGWAWALDRDTWASGAERPSTNQRMEIRAALEAVSSLSGPLVVVSDSTYVVNCFRDRWWAGWQQRGWTNSQKKPVANRDLWEPLVEAVNQRGDVAFQWVKGHSGHEMNAFVDQLAVAAAAAGD